MSTFLVTIQALAAATSALTAFFLARLTVRRDAEGREERDVDRAQDQLRRLVDGLGALSQVIRSRDATAIEFEVARAEFAAALAIRRGSLLACQRLLDDDMPAPPYALQDSEPWIRLEAAAVEIRRYAQTREVLEIMRRARLQRETEDPGA